MTVLVRDAVASDVPWLLEQLRAFDAFFGASKPVFPDPEFASTQLRQLIATGGFYVAEDVTPGRVSPVGFIGGALYPHPFNPSIRVLGEMFWWVAEPFRGGSAGARLLDRFLGYGRENADWIVFTLEAESPVNPATLERRGFRLKERNYLLECEVS